MSHGKKGFERIVWAFKNVLNKAVSWLFHDLDEKVDMNNDGKLVSENRLSKEEGTTGGVLFVYDRTSNLAASSGYKIIVPDHYKDERCHCPNNFSFACFNHTPGFRGLGF
jgi:hypothetical protein